jgi:hypothetical protein
MLLHCDDLFTPSVILTLPLCGCVVGRMASQAQSARIRPRRWLKRAGWALLVFAFLLGAGFACVFVRVVPPRSVRVVDALTGKPVSGVNVCMQAIATGLGSKEALRSSLSTTGADGRAFFWPSVELMGLLQSWYGYSIQVTDPKSAFIRTCGPAVGFGLVSNQFADDFPRQFADSRTDRSEHFPVELVDPDALPKNIGWFPFMRGANFRALMSVELFPILPDPDECKQVTDPRLLQECTRLNTLAENALLQELVPMYFAGMQRSATDNIGGWSPQSRVYNAVYESHSSPDRFMAVTVERFPKGQRAIDHFNDIERAIPGYDPNNVTEDEVIPGQRIKQILSAQTPRAFWASQNLLVLITFITPSPLDRALTGQWLMRHPCSAASDRH